MRLSVRVSSAPEKTLLKPRTTTLLWAKPVWEKSTAGRSRMCSATLSAGRLRMSLASTTATEAGASRTFSCRREAETTFWSRKMSPVSSLSLSSCSPPTIPTPSLIRGR